MRGFLLLSLLWNCFLFFGQAQFRPSCGVQKYYNDHPIEKYKRDYIFNENLKKQHIKWSDRQQTVYNIPVVVHVIHDNGAENISNAQIESQITSLNEDFRRLNADASNTPASFTSVAADMQINFFLAQKDPNGNCHDGINRVQSSTYTELNQANDANLKALIQWDPSMYLNIWVVRSIDNGNLIGYAYFPGVTPSLDGLVIAHEYFGTLGTVSAPYNKGRTAVHEIGHYFGLHHVWGQNAGGCSDDDGFSDTPIQNTENYGCPTHPSMSCSNSGDMFMNYMDYTDDQCMNLFTNEQKTFAHNHLVNTAGRNTQHLASNLNATGFYGCGASGGAPNAEFSTSNTNISVGASINFTDLSTNSPTSWSWTFSGGSPNTSSVQNPTSISYSNSGNYDVQLIVNNSSGADTMLKTNYINVSGSNGPTAAFTSSTPNPQLYQAVTFTDISTNNPTSWSWSISPQTYNLLNNSTLSDQNIQVEFTSVGTYQVDLSVSNSGGANSTSQFIFVSDNPCDSIFHYSFPSYYVDNNYTTGFLTYEIDDDQNMPPNYLSSITISDIPADYGIETPDLYFKLEDSSSNNIWTSTTVDDTDPPVSWNISHLLMDEDYSVEVYDEDAVFDDYLGTAIFYGLNYSGSAYDYSNSNGTLQVDYVTTRFGITSGWMDFDETVNGAQNNYTGVTSEYVPAGQADDWLNFGPITIPSTGAQLKWKHKFGDNNKRNAYRVMINEFGPLANNFNFGGDTLTEFSDNDMMTNNHTQWTDQVLQLDGATYGGKSIYVGFHHFADDMDMLYLDEIKISTCVVTDIAQKTKSSSVVIYPNPFNYNLNVDFEEVNDKNSCLVMFNNIGQEVIFTSIEEGERSLMLNTEHLSNGFYIIALKINGESFQRKLMLQK